LQPFSIKKKMEDGSTAQTREGRGKPKHKRENIAIITRNNKILSKRYKMLFMKGAIK
jgi:hypothetical protein